MTSSKKGNPPGSPSNTSSPSMTPTGPLCPHRECTGTPHWRTGRAYVAAVPRRRSPRVRPATDRRGPDFLCPYRSPVTARMASRRRSGRSIQVSTRPPPNRRTTATEPGRTKPRSDALSSARAHTRPGRSSRRSDVQSVTVAGRAAAPDRRQIPISGSTVGPSTPSEIRLHPPVTPARQSAGVDGERLAGYVTARFGRFASICSKRSGFRPCLLDRGGSR
jgi:hypothetical protein